MQWKHTSSAFSRKFRLWPQLESSCYRSLGFPRPFVNIIWVQHRLGMTVTSAQYFSVMRNELQPAFCTKQKGRLTQWFFFCLLVTWQCMLSYPYSDHPWNTELEIFGHPPHMSPGLFWFLTPRTIKGDMSLTVCSWCWCEGGSVWLIFHTSKEQVF